MVCGLLERFGGYTYTSLMAEDPALLRWVAIDAYSPRHDPPET